MKCTPIHIPPYYLMCQKTFQYVPNAVCQQYKDVLLMSGRILHHGGHNAFLTADYSSPLKADVTSTLCETDCKCGAVISNSEEFPWQY